MPLPIDAETLKAWLADGEEIALLDAREEAAFGRAHPLWAAPCPLSRAPLLTRALLPRLSVRIVVMDGGAGEEAATLAAYLEGIGCPDVSLLDGGVAAWEEAGFEAFSGPGALARAFAAHLAEEARPPLMPPAELARARAEGADLVLIDTRPPEEFRALSLPGAVNLPLGELPWRIGALVPGAETVVVMAAGAGAFSALAAESAKRAGLANPVFALEGGLMGWRLAGLPLEPGAPAPLAEPAAPSAARRKALARFAEEAGVRVIDLAGLAALRRDLARSTYLLDIREAADYLAGHLPAARHAPGAALLARPESVIAVRGARIVLVDAGEAAGDGLRARLVAAWLRRMGAWAVHVLADAPGQRLLPGRPPPDCPEALGIEAPEIQPGELAAAMMVGGAALVDLRRSVAYRRGHVPGALWGLRTRLAALAPRLKGVRQVVVEGSEPALARLALPELAALLPGMPLAVLAGGTEAWWRAGLPLAEGGGLADEDCIDVQLRPMERAAGMEAAMRETLAWERGLAEAAARDGDAPFVRR